MRVHTSLFVLVALVCSPWNLWTRSSSPHFLCSASKPNFLHLLGQHVTIGYVDGGFGEKLDIFLVFLNSQFTTFFLLFNIIHYWSRSNDNIFTVCVSEFFMQAFWWLLIVLYWESQWWEITCYSWYEFGHQPVHNCQLSADTLAFLPVIGTYHQYYLSISSEEIHEVKVR